MPSEANQQNTSPSFSKKMILAILLVSTVMLTLAACKPQQNNGNTVYGNNGIPRDVVTVFFSKYQGSQSIVEDVVRKLPKGTKSDPLQYALTELLKGPTTEERNQGFYSEIPKGTHLISMKKDRDAVTINLSQQFTKGGGSTSMVQRFEELKQTVFSNDSKNQINLAVEGKPIELLGGEGLEVQDSLKRQPQ